jgi:hypothetical protein
MSRCYCVSLDLGQKQDHSAAAVLERAWWWPRAKAWTFMSNLPEKRSRDALRDEGDLFAPEGVEAFHAMPLQLLHIERFPIGTPYPDIVSAVSSLLEKLMTRTYDDINFVVDCTGVGAPIVDLFRRRDHLPPAVAITITGGVEVVERNGLDMSVPKRDLVMAAVAAIETGKLSWPATMPHRDLLEGELRSFQMKYSKTGHEMFEAERREHDDLVLSFAMAVWYLVTQTPRHRLFLFGGGEE